MIKEYAKAYNQILSALLKQAQKLSLANGAVLEIKEGENLHYLSVSGILEPLLDHKIPITGTISGTCFKTKQSKSCEDVKNNPSSEIARITFANLNVNSMIVIPIIVGNDVKAVLKLTSEDANHFCEHCVDDFQEWLNPLIKSIAAALIDAELYAARNQILADKSTKITLKRFAHHMFEGKQDFDKMLLIFDELAKSVNCGVFVTDLNGKCVYTNLIYQELRDLTEDELLGEGWVNQIHPDDLEFIQTIWTNSINLQTNFQFKYRMYDKAGKIKTCLANSVPLLQDNRIFGHIGTVVEEEIPQVA